MLRSRASNTLAIDVSSFFEPREDLSDLSWTRSIRERWNEMPYSDASIRHRVQVREIILAMTIILSALPERNFFENDG